ncbi:hypothetical protein [Methanospirillum hungatei]|jgi:thiol-disulfide isomerase/thioredoxin|nr:hypothetical protein [Methanospirillum hungatei]MBP9008320.1 hypothetical protein [Methanospirillum sp.]HOW05198.1 hypothetical protein [Methanospirillum hungatei]
MEKIERGMYSLILLVNLVILMLIPACSGAIFQKDGTEITRDEVTKIFTHNSIFHENSPIQIQFFYSSGCGSCKDVLQFLQSYERKNPSVLIEFRNLVYDEENRQLFTEYKNQFNYSKISYPALFIGDIGITGSSDIIHITDSVVKGYQNL